MKEIIREEMDELKEKYERLGSDFIKNFNKEKAESFIRWWTKTTGADIRIIMDKLGIKYVGHVHEKDTVTEEEYWKIVDEIVDVFQASFLNGVWEALISSGAKYIDMENSIVYR